MAMMRQNPLPIGDYWDDVFAKDWTTFHAWLAKNKSTVQVKTTESTWVTTTDPPVDAQGDPAREWYLFHVSGPTKWEGPGFPTIATSDIKSSADTVQRPPPEMDPLDKLSAGLSGLGSVGGTAAKIGVGVLVVGIVGGGIALAVWSFSKARSAPHE